MFRIRTVLAGVAVAAAAVLAVAAPASAHDEIVSSSPASGEQLTTAPDQVVLTFSNNLLELAGNNGTAVVVADGSGADWVSGDPVVSADTVTVPLKSGMPDGDFTVTWQVVSSDGHPTSGEYVFSLAVPEAAPTPSATAAETAAPVETTAPAETTSPASPEATQAPSETEAAPWPLLIGLGVVLIAAIVIVILITVRKRRS
ncbi:MAG TPA: copper resistance CopC family protein [Microbacterium sp.]|nr:copper resistance CopC family protein [Microbacterium sp.]